jgi:hypothetical protein
MGSLYSSPGVCQLRCCCGLLGTVALGLSARGVSSVEVSQHLSREASTSAGLDALSNGPRADHGRLVPASLGLGVSLAEVSEQLTREAATGTDLDPVLLRPDTDSGGVGLGESSSDVGLGHFVLLGGWCLAVVVPF